VTVVIVVAFPFVAYAVTGSNVFVTDAASGKQATVFGSSLALKTAIGGPTTAGKWANVDQGTGANNTQGFRDTSSNIADSLNAAAPVKGTTVGTSTVSLRVARPQNFKVPDTVPENCATSDVSVLHCYVLNIGSWRLRVLCIRPGSAVVTLRGRGPVQTKSVECTPLPPDTTDFTSGGPSITAVHLTSCVPSDPAVVCLRTGPVVRSARITYFCRHPATATVTVRILDASFVLTHVCGYEKSLTVAVGTSRATALPRTQQLGISTDGCQSSDEAIAHCWTHGENKQGLSMHCFKPGDVILMLDGVLGGDMEMHLSCLPA
jgi:hypothetical protein